MVSGLRTSPCDHERIFSGEASEIRSALKLSGFFGFSNSVNRSSIDSPCYRAPSDRFGLLLFEELDVEREALELLHHDVEGLRQTWFEHILPLDDGLVHTGSPAPVV